MNDNHYEETPLVPRDDPRDANGSPPQAAALPDADRKRLEALLSELLRDDAIRKLLCIKDRLVPPDGGAEHLENELSAEPK